MSVELKAYLLSCDFDLSAVIEGSSSAESLDWLIHIISLHAPHSKNIMEIGLNLGYSSDRLLKDTNAHITSFDLEEFAYSGFVEEYFQKYYPTRFNVIWGDSTSTVSSYADETQQVFDVIFIDGGHDYDIVKADLENCSLLSDEKTVIILDDYVKSGYFSGSPVFAQAWNIGPTKAWDEMVAAGMIEEIEGTYKIFDGGRGHIAGRYI